MSKGASQSTTMKIPDWLQDDVEANLARSQEISQIGYTPYQGPSVAALTPMQTAAMGNVMATAKSAGFNTPANMGIPKAQTFAGGMQGYSAMPLYNQALAQFEQQTPGQFNAMQSQFINPVTGAAPTASSMTNLTKPIVDDKKKVVTEKPETKWWNNG